MDGSDELAASVGERPGGVRAAIRFSCADDAGASEIEAQEGARAGYGQPGRRGKTSWGGAGPFRQLSRDPVNAQVWIAVLVGLAAMIDDLARRQIANWIPLSALAAGFGWQIGAERVERIVVCGNRDGGGFFGFSDFLPAGRHGRGRRETDGGFRSVARLSSTDCRRVVDRGCRRRDRFRRFGRAGFAARVGLDNECSSESRCGTGFDSLRSSDCVGSLVVAGGKRSSGHRHRGEQVWIAGF